MKGILACGTGPCARIKQHNTYKISLRTDIRKMPVVLVENPASEKLSWIPVKAPLAALIQDMGLSRA